MITAIRDLGDLEAYHYSKSSDDNLLTKAQMIAENPAPRGMEVELYVLIDEVGGRLNREEFDVENYQKYLFKDVHAKRPYWAPTFKSSGKLDRHGKMKCDSFFEDWKVEPETVQLFYKLREEIQEVWTSKSKKTILFTTKIRNKYPGERPDVIKTFLERFEKEQQEVIKGINSVGEGTCSVCMQQKTVFGASRPFNFYSPDKQGFFVEFDRKNAWKNFPVCRDCSVYLQVGKTVLKNRLRTVLASFSCFLIPKFFWFQKYRETIIEKDLLAPFEAICALKLHSRDLTQAGAEEEDLLKALQQLDMLATCDFLLFEKRQAAFIILNHIQDVLPSRIAKVYSAIKELNYHIEADRQWFGELRDYMSESGFDPGFTLDRLTQVLGSPTAKKGYRPHQQTLLNLLGAIFLDKIISRKEIFRHLAANLEFIVKHGKSPTFTTYRMFQLIHFLQDLGVLQVDINEEKQVKVNDKILPAAQFIAEHLTFFGDAEREVTFLVGGLFGKLEAVQRARLAGNAPIVEVLSGLDLSENRLQKIFVAVVKKMKEYSKPKPVYGARIRAYTEFLSKRWTECPAPWNLSIDEMKFQFTLGWTLSRQLLPPFGKREKIENKKE